MFCILYFKYIIIIIIYLYERIKLENTTKVQIALEVLYGMLYLLRSEVYHDGFTIDNIMLNENFESKIMVLSIFDRQYKKQYENYIASSFDIDQCSNSYVHSFGEILHELFIGPFNNTDNKKSELKQSETISQFGLDIIKKCLDPSSKPSLEELLIEIRNKYYMLAPGIEKQQIDNRLQEIIRFEENNPPKPIRLVFK